MKEITDEKGIYLSRATAMVTGVAGLIWSIAPHFTREEVMGIIMDTVTDGQLNAEAAVKEAKRRVEVLR